MSATSLPLIGAADPRLNRLSRGRRWGWRTILASLAAHLIVLLAFLFSPAEPPSEGAPPPGFDVVYENGPAAGPTADTPQPGAARDDRSAPPQAAAPTPTDQPQAAEPPSPPAPPPTPPTPPAEPAPPRQTAALSVPAPPPPTIDQAPTAPAPLPIPPTVSLPEPTLPPPVPIPVPLPPGPALPPLMAEPPSPAPVSRPLTRPVPTPPRPPTPQTAQPRPSAPPRPFARPAFPAPEMNAFSLTPPTTRPGTGGARGRNAPLSFAYGSTGHGPGILEQTSARVSAGATADWRRLVEAWIHSRMYYPRQAAENGEDGASEVRAVIDADGRVTSVEVTNRSGSIWLDAATLAIFRGAKLPSLPPNTPTPLTVDLTVNYILIRR